MLGLSEPSLPFGVDLAIPQLGGTARKTNHDYTHGHLEELIDIIAASGAKLFICAVGVPPCWVMEKLHAAQVLVANMVGSVRNAEKALEAKVEPRMRDLGGSEPQIAVFSWWIYCF